MTVRNTTRLFQSLIQRTNLKKIMIFTTNDKIRMVASRVTKRILMIHLSKGRATNGEKSGAF